MEGKFVTNIWTWRLYVPGPSGYCGDILKHTYNDGTARWVNGRGVQMLPDQAEKLFRRAIEFRTASRVDV